MASYDRLDQLFTPRRYRSRAAPNWTWTGWTTQPGYNLLSSSDWDKQDSVSTPGYKQKKRTILPENQYYKGWHVWRPVDLIELQQFYDSADQLIHETEWNNSSHLRVTLGPEPGEVPSHPERNTALARLQEDISQSKGSAAVTMAEMNKTMKMVTDTAVKLAKAYSHLRKGNMGAFSATMGLPATKRTRQYQRRADIARSRGENLDGFASKTWLEYTYGWMPLISDVYSQAENLATLLTEHQYIVREVKGSAKYDQGDVTRTILNESYAKVTKTYRVITRTRFTIRYKIEETSVANVFGLSNPALVAWELLPFSFVVDWFLPIGNFIEGLTAYNGLSFHSGTEVQKVHYASIATGINPPGHRVPNGSGYWTYKFDKNDFGWMTTADKRRIVLTEFPHQTLPVFKDPRSLSHAVSAMALLKQVFGKKH